MTAISEAEAWRRWTAFTDAAHVAPDTLKDAETLAARFNTWNDGLPMTPDDVTALMPENQEQDIEQEAFDLALNDCQLWDNLPPSAREFYRQEARDNLTTEGEVK